MNNSSSMMTLVLWDDNEPIGRVLVTETDLASTSGRYEIEEASRTSAQNLEKSLLNSSVLPVFHTFENMKDRIRSTMRDFQFQDTQATSQSITTLDIALQPYKFVNILYKNTSYPMTVLRSDTGQQLIKRFEETYKIRTSNLITMYIWSSYQYKFVHSIVDFSLSLFDEIGEFKHICLAYGDATNHSSMTVKTCVIASLNNEPPCNFLFTSNEHTESFKSRVDFVFLKPNKYSSVSSDIYKWAFDMSRIVYKYKEISKDANLGDIGIENATLHWIFKWRGGGISLPIDFSGVTVANGKGVSTSKHWEAYKNGLNIMAMCKDKRCKSRRNLVCVNLDYPKHLIFTDGKNYFKCPACLQEPVSIQTFLVSNARAKFKFTKTGEDHVETLVLEPSSPGYQNYALLDDAIATNSKDVEYDYIEVDTVEYGVSFNECQYCGYSILLEEEVILGCGRSFHNACLGDTKNCPICDIPNYTIDEIPGLMSSNGYKHGQLKVPNHLFGSCHSKNVDQMGRFKPIAGFMKALASSQIQTNDDNFQVGLEVQENFVTENLTQLIKNTTVNTLVLARLKQKKILSEEEEQKLSCDSMSETEKCRRLYRIVPKRESGITSLLVVLEEERQSGAVMILSKYFSYRVKPQ